LNGKEGDAGIEHGKGDAVCSVYIELPVDQNVIPRNFLMAAACLKSRNSGNTQEHGFPP